MNERFNPKKEKPKDEKKRMDPNNIKPVKDKGDQVAEGVAHPVATATKISKLNMHTWFHKRLVATRERPEVFQIEGALGDFYRIAVGVREPKNRPVASHDFHEGTYAIMSKGVEGYQSLEKRSLDLSNKQQKEDLAEILVACHFFVEKDLHKDNIGFNSDGRLVKIDHGMSLWPITQRYALKHNEEKGAIKISPYDLQKFPNNDENSQSKCVIMPDSAVDKLASDPDFINAKFKTMLKIALMPDKAFEGIAEAYISSSDLAKEVSEFLIERRDQLTQALYETPEFFTFLGNNPDIFEKIDNEIDEYNRTVKDKDEERRVSSMSQRRFQAFGDDTLRFYDAKHKMTGMIHVRLAALANDTSMLATAKTALYNDLLEGVQTARDIEQMRGTFTEWLNNRYHADDNSDMDNQTARDILSTRRNSWDFFPPHSVKFIDNATDLLKVPVVTEADEIKKFMDDYDDYDDYDNSNHGKPHI
jgi:hypothetical protein